MARTVLAALVSALSLWMGAKADCSFIQTCPQGPGCHPVPVEAPNNKPFLYDNSSVASVCPEYTEMCCTPDQMSSLSVNFMLIESTFGTGNGGCDACVQNLIHFWCAFTCSPDQAEFVTTKGFQNVTDPNNPGPQVLVLTSVISMSREYACGVFASCKDTPTAQENTVMSTCPSFFLYMGESQAIQFGSDSNFTFSDSESAMSLPLDNCCNYQPFKNIPFDNTPEGDNTSCLCNTCSGACPGGTCFGGVEYISTNTSTVIPPNVGAPIYGVMHGFNGAIIGGVYGGIFLVSLAFLYFNRRPKSSGADYVSQLARNPDSYGSAPLLQGQRGVVGRPL